jgi:hypothetical protein
MESKSMRLSSKVIAFTLIMAALGNTLSALSIGLTKVGQIGLDLSHIATFIASVYGGPVMGFLIGLVGGIVPGVYFGPMGGLSWLGLIGLPVGKALTGVTTGALCKLVNVNQRAHPSILTVPVVLIGYIPECLFTIFFFLVLVPYFFGWASVSLLISILVKAWIEIGVMSVLMGALTGNGGFNTFMTKILTLHKVK